MQSFVPSVQYTRGIRNEKMHIVILSVLLRGVQSSMGCISCLKCNHDAQITWMVPVRHRPRPLKNNFFTKLLNFDPVNNSNLKVVISCMLVKILYF